MVTSGSQESDFGTSVRTDQSQNMGEEAALGIGAALRVAEPGLGLWGWHGANGVRASGVVLPGCRARLCRSVLGSRG